MPGLDEIQLKVSTLGADASLNQIKAVRKEAQGLYADAASGSEEQKVLGQTLNGLDQRVKELRPNYEKFRDISRAHRQEMFLFRFAVIELLAPLSAMGVGAQKITQTLQGVISSGMGVSTALQVMGGRFADVSSPVGILVGGIVALVSANKALAENQERLNKDYETYNDLLTKSGKLTDEQVRKMLEARLQTAKAAEKGAGGGFNLSNLWQGFLGTVTGGTSGMASAVATNVQAGQVEAATVTEKAQQALDEFNAKSRKRLEDQATSSRGTGDKMVEWYFDNQEKMFTKHQEVLQAQQRYDDMVAANHQKAVDVAEEVRFNKWKENQQRLAELTQPIIDGFQAVGNAIQQGIIDKLHLGNTLLGQFTSALVAGFINLGVNYLTGGLGSILGIVPHASGGMITEPIVGRGLWTGAMHTFGENGKPEMVMPMDGSRSNVNVQPVFIIGNRIKGTEMYQFVRSGQRTYNLTSR